MKFGNTQVFIPNLPWKLIRLPWVVTLTQPSLPHIVADVKINKWSHYGSLRGKTAECKYLLNI